MSTTNDPGPGSAGDPQRARKGRGCLFWGCTTLFLVVLIAGGSIAWVVWRIVDEVEEVSSADPVPVPGYTAAPGQVEELTEQLEQLVAADEAGAPVPSVTLEASDLNALIGAAGPGLRERVHVTSIENGHVDLQLSVPLDRSLPGLEGRWFNGTARLRIVEGRGGLRPVAEVVRTHDGRELSSRTADILSQFAWALAKEALARSDDPRHGDLLRHGHVEVQDGRIVLSAAKSEASETAEPASSASD